MLLLLLPCASSAYADDRSNVELSLVQGISSVNRPFSVSNLLPGDDESIDVQLLVAHVDALSVWFQADVVEDPSALSRALELRVVDVASNVMIWQGTLDDLNEHPVSVPVSASEGGETTLSWRIEAGLPAQAGNEYQLARCTADLQWYVQGDDQSKLTPLTSTGDSLPHVLLALALAVGTGALAIVAIRRRRAALAVADVSSSAPMGAHAAVSPISSDDEDGDDDAAAARRRGLLTCLAVVAALLLVAAAAWALIWARASLPQSVFETGSVAVQLNDGHPVFPEGSVSLEPGSTVVREFSVGNTGTADVFYRIYLENLQGGLASALDVRVFRGETMLYQGSALGLEQRDACVSDKVLAPGQTDVLRIEVRMADGSGNGYQGEDVSFDLCAQVVQTKNNEGRDLS
ncbi:hypothetical protein C1879_07780 [Paraeggerthella hongkongensis]|uniref:hypothetical protein n=1 Tax=Paraeggerthella sp. TaxID=2897350 RepID=UPI000DF7662E|nr:hypothetical protein C1879_07780 [Paraeggerthella hongkongensis]